MVAEVPTVTVYAGDTLDWPTYTLKNAANLPRNLIAEGWADWKAQWRSKPEATVAIDLEVNADQAASGVLKLRATGEQTEAMKGPGFWDLQASSGVRIQTFLRGKTKWTQDVTRG